MMHPYLVTFAACMFVAAGGSLRHPRFHSAHVVDECLPLSVTFDMTQDNWRLTMPEPGRVTIHVDVPESNAECAESVACAAYPDISQGPLDPQVAIYPPGINPTPGAFNMYRAPSCHFDVTGDATCLTPPRQGSECLACDNLPCSLSSAQDGGCVHLCAYLDEAGDWTIAVAAQTSTEDWRARQGCYRLTVEGAIGPLRLAEDDTIVTF